MLTEIEEFKKTPSKINQGKFTQKINNLEILAKQLLKEIQELKTEIQEVKEEGDNSPSALSFVYQKEQELQVKQSRWQELNSIITNNNNPEPFPYLPVLGTVGIAALLVLIVYSLSKKRVRR